MLSDYCPKKKFMNKQSFNIYYFLNHTKFLEKEKKYIFVLVRALCSHRIHNRTCRNSLTGLATVIK